MYDVQILPVFKEITVERLTDYIALVQDARRLEDAEFYHRKAISAVEALLECATLIYAVLFSS